ncbi:HAD family hydrolase [Halomonas elongata]|uniref:HAD superfamily hydrolase n=1 Tax=Halomonas elongata (strain ATCC 33173 / DSM 2581 / NBRC 15536 / NCIMB 2198 / 1H9) TaxID=768066 RepID=E1VCL6_HALED|nr:HAD-IA family hydrolase [Halomonas elongata]RAW08887.1 HAD family hydrolase [Halomonas elongata]WBF19656.1 HAD-IA family hydrolase [Halomonas elongata]WPU48521.1 HAD-IA family hydrolase [Halomonas elongata DSM 2581]WVI73087.1 HAD-IA family hydrolase [Halomonas elongata]CBV42371.1 HAD superfamily hydrolase [Halomonas elongata DSM 2581]
MERLIFDCDGVLVDSEAIAEATLVERLSAWLPDIDIQARLSEALGLTTEAILERLETLSRHALPGDALGAIDQEIERRLAKELHAIDGVAEVIERLGMPMAVVSNSHRGRVRDSLAHTGLDALLDGAPIFCAEQVAHPKPDPAIYRLAAETLEASAEHCLVVEDSVAGASAARAAGMTVIGFTGASHVPPGQAKRLLDAGAWRVMGHMHELPSLVTAWRKQRLSG